MKALEEKITAEGKVYPGNILKVDGFLNHCIDVPFMMQIGLEIARLFEGCGVTKVLTVESSGIAIAVAAGAAMNVPAIFAKKGRPGNMSDGVYKTVVESFTHKNTNEITVSSEYLLPEDTVLIVDDFLARGNALVGLIDIVHQSGAKLAGAAVVIEKGFQSGGAKVRNMGVRVESLALIESMENGKILFR